MTLTLATLITGLLVLALGVALALPFPAVVTSIKRFPRSRRMAYALFSIGAVWFLYRIAHLTAADFGDFKKQLFVFFAAVAIASFKYVPDFLAVRGACILVLLGASHLLSPGYMVWDYGELSDFGRIYWYKIAVYIAVTLAIYLGASPFRLRDFFEWLYRKPGRAQVFGGILGLYGLFVMGVSFAY
jgi:hypothetical protein